MVYQLCPVCKRPYDGMNCLRCTQASIFLQGFGQETLGQTQSSSPGIVARLPVSDDNAKLKLPDGQMYCVPKPTCRIGQDSTNDIVINDDNFTAKFHAQISFDDKENEYVIRDLGTKEGTFLNGAPVHLDQVVFNGDQIKIGKNKFYFISDLDM